LEKTLASVKSSLQKPSAACSMMSLGEEEETGCAALPNVPPPKPNDEEFKDEDLKDGAGGGRGPPNSPPPD